LLHPHFFAPFIKFVAIQMQWNKINYLFQYEVIIDLVIFFQLMLPDGNFRQYANSCDIGYWSAGLGDPKPFVLPLKLHWYLDSPPRYYRWRNFSRWKRVFLPNINSLTRAISSCVPLDRSWSKMWL
jgi:hypothetical protein